MSEDLNAQIDLNKSLQQAVSYFSSGDVSQFSDCCRELIQTAPSAPESYFMMGIMGFLTNDPGLAIQMINRAHEIDPECGTYADVLANLYSRTGRLNDGVYFAKLSSILDPHPVLNDLVVSGLDNFFQSMQDAEVPDFFKEAVRAFDSGNFEAAILCCEKNIRLERREPELYLLNGRAYMETGQYIEALSMFRALVHMQPEEPKYRLFLAETLLMLGRTGQAEACLLSAQNLDGGATLVSSMLARSVVSGVEAGPATDGLVATNIENEAAKFPKTLRIGIISDQFRDIPGSRLLDPWLRFSDSAAVEIICYNTCDIRDRVTLDLKGQASKWSDVADIDEQTFLYILDADHLDILCDYTLNWQFARDQAYRACNANRKIGLASQSISAEKIGATDLLTMDGLVDVARFNAMSFDQRVSALSVSGIAQMVVQKTVEKMPIEGSDGPPTFGGVFDLSRITPETAVYWAEILKSQKESMLVLTSPKQVSQEVMSEAYELFGNLGVLNQLRIHRREKGEGFNDFLRYIDVLLQPSPGMDITEVYDAMAAGRPVVVKQASTDADPLSLAMMTGISLDRWVAADWPSYVDLAANIVDGVRGGAITASGTQKNSLANSSGAAQDTILKLHAILKTQVGKA